jgi:transposase
MSDLFWLNDAQGARLRPLLRTDVRGVPRVDDRRVISGIIDVLRSGYRSVDTPTVLRPSQDSLQSLRAPKAA